MGSIMKPANGGEAAGATVAANARVAEAAPLFGDGVEEIGVTDASGARVGRLSRTDVVELMMRG